MLIHINDFDDVVALHLKPTVALLWRPQRRREAAQHDANVASNRKTFQVLNIAACGFTLDDDRCTGLQHSEIGVFDLHKQSLARFDFQELLIIGSH